MDSLRALIDKYVCNSELILSATASNARDKQKISRIKIRPVIKNSKDGEKVIYQAESFVGNQAFHKNIEDKELADYIVKVMTEDFKQLEMDTQLHTVTALVSKKGKVTLKEKKKPQNVNSVTEDLKKKFSHNREKQYILPKDVPVPFLVELGVQTAEGRVVNAKYDKFRQINRYLEFIRDIVPYLPDTKKTGRKLNIIDFGCGKSYLTFATYYYLKIMNNMDVHVIGLDLKKDVINHCQKLADKFGYEDLKFLVGDISTYTGDEEGNPQVDMVITLHACDTATDYALAHAVEWGASVILSVPCCQHELNRQISCEALAPLLKYGIIKERMAALMTDAIRANLLEQQGYDTQILEFIDMEHTPKNILIRAVKKQSQNMVYAPVKKDKNKSLEDLEEFLNVSPTLSKLL